jgi:DNA-binding ferritin-like protein (Dps family)
MAEDKKEKKEVKAKANKFPQELYDKFITNYTWDEARLTAFMKRNDIPFEE